jgi:hypothetical protein
MMIALMPCVINWLRDHKTKNISGCGDGIGSTIGMGAAELQSRPE